MGKLPSLYASLGAGNERLNKEDVQTLGVQSNYLLMNSTPQTDTSEDTTFALWVGYVVTFSIISLSVCLVFFCIKYKQIIKKKYMQGKT